MLLEKLRPNYNSSNIPVLLEIKGELKSKAIFAFQDTQPPQIMIQYATPKLLRSKASELHYLNIYAILPNITFKHSSKPGLMMVMKTFSFYLK